MTENSVNGGERVHLSRQNSVEF